MVGFRKIVVVSIAPVSKITAVKHELVHSFPYSGAKVKGTVHVDLTKRPIN
jgi:hypothetical protein